MNIKAKILIIGLLLLSCQTIQAQYMRTRGASNIEASFFGSDNGQGLRLGYGKYLSSTFALNPALFYEWGNPLQSSYSNIGADFLIGVIPFHLGDKFVFTIKGGLTGGHEKLTGIENDVSGFSVGVKGGGDAELVVSEMLSFNAYAHQAYLAKKVFGRSYYHLGVGIKINIYRY